MRHLLTFTAAGSMLGASLDDANGSTGLLMVTGGSQTRVGSHRLYERLATALAQAGHPCFRFDRRGVGDSEGDNQGYRGSRDDLLTAAAAFRARAPNLRRLIGFGLCDGATALMLFGAEAGLDGLLLVNPWLVEAEPDAPPPTALRRHYRDRLASAGQWRRLLTGRVSLRKLARGLGRAAAQDRADLGRDACAAVRASRLPTRLLLARSDATAIAAERVWRSAGGAPPIVIDTDSHTFARSGDLDALRTAVLSALAQFESD